MALAKLKRYDIVEIKRLMNLKQAICKCGKLLTNGAHKCVSCCFSGRERN